MSVWLAGELDSLDGAKGAPHGVITPAARGKNAETISGDEGPLTAGLNVVLKRTRWKAAACRISVDRQGLRHLEGGERSAAEAQLANRERVLREALVELRDTIPWMLDQPFGIRSSQEQAFDVPDEIAAKLGVVADCYETLSMAVEKARELEEAGAFHDGPPRAFLYLLAEAQSALLGSIAEAPVRSDSDQRDVFLWLKEQTTRFRIYVDRHMRLDDLADCSQSADLNERVSKLVNGLLSERKDRRQRGQLLSKVRYHVSKLLDDGGATRSEADSLSVAVKRWVGAGLDRTDRGLTDALHGLRSKVDSMDEEVGAVLRTLLGNGRSEPTSVERDDGSEGRQAQSLEEVRQLLGSLSVLLLAPPGSEVEPESLAAELGAGDLEALTIEVDGDKGERDAALSNALSKDGSRLFLLGVRLAPEEYNAFKESCLEQKFAFVRLPGQMNAAAIAHQVMRQVGWRLRAQLDEAAT